MSQETNFNDLPSELQEYILSFVPTDNCINTAKVSRKWLSLTVSAISEITRLNMYAVDHLAVLVNEERKTNYDGVSLLNLMPKLEKLEVTTTRKSIWEKHIPILPQLKVLQIFSRYSRERMIDFKELNVQFERLIKFSYDGTEDLFPLSIFEFAPKLKILTIRELRITQAWHKKIPETVKQFTVENGSLDSSVRSRDLILFEFLFKNPAALEKFEFKGYVSVNFEDFSMVPNLKTLTLDDGLSVGGLCLRNAFRACRSLGKVQTYNICVTKDWYKAIPQNVTSLSLQELKVQEDLQDDFCFDYLFENIDSLQELEIKNLKLKEPNPGKFRCRKRMRKLHLQNYSSYSSPSPLFSTICLTMIRCSSLVDVAFDRLEIGKAWKNAVPDTVEHLSLMNCWVNKEATDVFCPQFLCTAPTNMRTMVMRFTSATDSAYKFPAMDIDSFQGMSKLTTLSLIGYEMSNACLKSVLKNCPSLDTLEVYGSHEEFEKNLSELGKGQLLLSLKTLRFYVRWWDEMKMGQRRHFEYYFPNVQHVGIVEMEN